MTDRYGATNTPEPAAETPGANSAASFDEHAVRIAERQYFQPGDDDVMGMFRRVAKAVAAAEQPGQEGAWEEAFFALMASKRFCPGGRVLAGAGTEHGNLLNCFPAGTEVITPEGYVPIEEIQPGAEVVTRSGAIRRVERIKARDVTEEMVTIRVHGRAADALRGTASHQVYAARGGAGACELIPLGELRVGDALLTQVDRTVREPEPFDLLAAYGHNFDSVREEDGRIRPVTRAIREYNGNFDRPATAAPFRRVEVRPALARLAGLYLAEGCITPTGVKWTVSRREEKLTEEIRRLICEVFGLPVRVCPAANQKHGWIDVYCNSALVREFFLENFGRYSHGKRLPLWAMQMPHHLQAALLSGVVAGDAYLGVRLRLVLANKQLIYQLYSLFQRLGIAGVSMLPANGKLSSKPTFSITSSSDEVTEAVRRLVATQQPPDRPVISRLGQRLVNGEVANVVTAVERDTEETTVFNFSVEDEHNYVVNYLAVKNCFVQAATEHEPDSMQGIMEVAEKLALVTKVGGGNGVHLGVLREQGARITGSGGSASGPVSFLRQIYAPILRVVRQGGCLHPDALVNTDRGTLRLGELVDPFQWGWQRHALKVATDAGWRDSPEGYNNGLAETLRVTLGNGAEVQGTPNHRLKVLRADGRREWVELAKLQPGDWAIQALDHHTGSDVLLRPLDRCHHNATRIRTPDRLSARVAYLLGCLWGDGYVHEHRVGLAVADGSPMESEAARLFRELFGLESRVERKPGELSSVVVVSSAALVEWLRLNGLSRGRAAELEVPRAVRQAPRAVLGAFLRGLFEADGTITSGYPILGAASHRLAHDVVALLAGLGIPAKLMRDNPTPGRFSKAGHYRVRVSTALGLERYLERVGVSPGSRFRKLFQVAPDERRESNWPLPHAEALLSRVFDGMPAGREGSPSTLTPLRKTLSRYLRGERTLTATGYAALAAEPALAAVLPALDFDEYYVRVESVVSAGISLTLDLSVDGNHTYLANGIVSHNTRRGAGMATLDVDHPDIFDFITCKDLAREQAEGKIETFNISVLASHAFMAAVRRDADWNLISRVDGRVVRTVRAREIFDAIAEHAWATGEPGLIFIDTVNDFNPMRRALGDINATNPCGEVVLYAGEPCDLGAINLAAFVTGRNQGLAGYDFAELERSTQVAVRFLDDVLDVNRFAVEQNRQMSEALRRLGLGVMGLADALIEMGLPYDTEDGRAAVTAILERMRDAAVAASEQLAGERGAFPWHDRAEGIPPRRNVAVLTVAPTGTTSMLFGVSSGVEPVFAPFIWRKIGDDFVPLLSPLFERVARERGFLSDELVRQIQANHGSVVGLGEVPEDVQRVFRCAHDVMPEDHVRMQAAVQNAFDGDGKMAMNSISKTINLPNRATVADVRKAYLLAYDLRCKGITVYRDGSRDLQVLSTSSSAGRAGAVTGRAWGDRLDLPRSLGSVRESVRFPDLSGGGKLYVNVGFVEDEGIRRPVEVFLNTKGLGPELQGHLIGYGRLIGEILRLGGSVENVEDALMGIQGVGLLQDQGDIVRSLPEAIALGIRRASGRGAGPAASPPSPERSGNGRGGNGHSRQSPAAVAGGQVAEVTGLGCPECGSEGLRREEGCYQCDVCGYSKCG